MSETDLMFHLVKDAVHLLVFVPFGMLMMKVASWGGFNEAFDLPTLSWKQCFGLSLIIIAVTV